MRSFLLAAAAATLMSGCASTPQAKFYTLGARPAQENAQTAPARLSISIDAVTVPELVDRPQMVVRIDATQVRIDEYARWAEPLKSQITNVLVADLAQALPGALVTGYGQWAGEAQSYHLQVDTDGEPFWLVLGESYSTGWSATCVGVGCWSVWSWCSIVAPRSRPTNWAPRSPAAAWSWACT